MQEQTPDADGSITRDLTPEQASSKVLSELLEATLSQGERSLSDHEWASLKSIVRQFEKSPLAFEDLVVALVEAFLRNRLSTTVKSLDSITNMSRSIGRTLCSDPVSRQRLMVFQQQLIGQQPS